MSTNIITITNVRRENAKELAKLQRVCYATLADHELLKEEHILTHCRIFPEGGFVASLGDKIVGFASGFYIDFDFKHAQKHTFKEIIAEGYYTNHQPNGEWYYGADISIHPDYRGNGIARYLYGARKDLVMKDNRRGIVAGGLMPTFAHYKRKMTAQEYIKRVISGEIFDSTLSVQMRNGFKIKGLVENYIDDPACDNWSALIVWENPHYTPHTKHHPVRS